MRSSNPTSFPKLGRRLVHLAHQPNETITAAHHAFVSRLASHWLLPSPLPTSRKVISTLLKPAGKSPKTSDKPAAHLLCMANIDVYSVRWLTRWTYVSSILKRKGPTVCRTFPHHPTLPMPQNSPRLVQTSWATVDCIPGPVSQKLPWIDLKASLSRAPLGWSR